MVDLLIRGLGDLQAVHGDAVEGRVVKHNLWDMGNKHLLADVHQQCTYTPKSACNENTPALHAKPAQVHDNTQGGF